ncbi:MULTISPECIES: hypothetical protein [unclassified Bradyrhizobium]|nr:MULTISPECIES: hypothetical protein [unclassified Bradyrhizobium]MCK1289204.1 hypothetical protein [Bradyrhizobium sp. 30]MCK1632146.1 hypothetical protein [Bradyrhizobium sp. 162]MCK1760517.1 hypothetical protein [Bradyrhizobium sp. 136]
MDTVEAAANEADSALSLITDSVADDPTVALAKIHYLRSRCEPETWWDFASERHRRYPDNENLAGAAAEARIDQAARWAETNQRRTLNRELRAQIAEAIAILEQMRQKFAGSEAAWDDNRMSLSVNLAVGLRLLRQHDEAKKGNRSGALRRPMNICRRALWQPLRSQPDSAMPRRRTYAV